MHEPIRTSTYYRTEDPLENLQLRIVIYEVWNAEFTIPYIYHLSPLLRYQNLEAMKIHKQGRSLFNTLVLSTGRRSCSVQGKVKRNTCFPDAIVKWYFLLLSDSEILDYITHKESKKGSAAQVFEVLCPFPCCAIQYLRFSFPSSVGEPSAAGADGEE